MRDGGVQRDSRNQEFFILEFRYDTRGHLRIVISPQVSANHEWLLEQFVKTCSSAMRHSSDLFWIDGGHSHQARDRNSPVRVSTLIFSPSLMYSGT